MKIYRDTGSRMLLKWGREMDQGGGKPNILALFDQGGHGQGEGTGPARVGAMFSPEAEKADLLLRDFKRLDLGICEYLVTYAFGFSITEMSRSFSCSRSKVQIELEGALSAFAMAVYYNAKHAQRQA